MNAKLNFKLTKEMRILGDHDLSTCTELQRSPATCFFRNSMSDKISLGVGSCPRGIIICGEQQKVKQVFN